MPLTRPTLDQIHARIRSDVVAGLGGGPLLDRSVLAVLAKANAGAVHGLYGAIEFASRQPFADTAEFEFLERIGAIVGVTRKAATFARGVVRVVGVDGTQVPAARRLVRADGAEFVTEARGQVSTGFANLAVRAVQAGEIGNTPEASTLSFASPISGLNQAATVIAGGLVGGLEVETDSDLRARVLQRLREPPAGGSAADYRRWTLEVAGVTRAWVFPQASGPGTVGVTFTTDAASTGPIPIGTKLAEVQGYLDARRPVTAWVVVYPPVARLVPVTVRVTPDTIPVRDAVRLALADLFRREAAPGSTLFLSHLRAAVSSAAGETDNVVTYPLADVVPEPGELPVLGEVLFA